MNSRDELREAICNAAEARFGHYGYGKTAMADIAGDCGISAAHLYNFFPGKLDIAAEIVRRDGARLAADLAARLRKLEGRPPAERVEAFLGAQLELTFQRLDATPGALEMARRISEKRPLVANEILARLRGLLAGLLGEGMKAGVFAARDPELTAEMIQAATVKFCYPQVTSRLGMDQLRRELDGVWDLLLNGLCAR